MPSSAALERTLDRTIEYLAGSTQTREARALLIEARRLRSVVGNWRSIPPPADVADEMVDRVLQLSAAVGSEIPESAGVLEQELEGRADGPEISTSDVADVSEDDDSYSLDFEPHLYSLETTTNRQAIPPPANPARRYYQDDPPAPPRPEPITGTRRFYADDSPQAATRPRASAVAPAPAPAPSPAPPRAPSPAPPPQRAAAVVPAPAPAPAPSPAPPRAPSVAPPPPEPPPRAASPAPLPPPPPEPPASPEPVSIPVPSLDPRAQVTRPRIEEPEPPATYDEGEGEGDLSVPRTQITAQAVKLSEPLNPLLMFLAEPYSQRADALRAMRRKLQGGANPAVIGVTSAHPGEGKTVFSANLALTLREGARGRVLLVEANLNAPALGKLMGFATPACFIAQLASHVEDPRAPWIVAEPLPKLHVIAADPKIKHEPLLDPVGFSLGMERLKQAGYEYIIVDSPPVIGSTNCNVISDAVDGMILTALPMKSRRKEMRKAVEQLEPAPMLGVVVLEI